MVGYTGFICSNNPIRLKTGGENIWNVSKKL